MPCRGLSPSSIAACAQPVGLSSPPAITQPPVSCRGGQRVPLQPGEVATGNRVVLQGLQKSSPISCDFNARHSSGL